MPNLNEKLEWTDVDQRAVDTARILAADAVEKVGSGHPGTAMSLAPVAYLLFQKVMNQDPGDDRWQGRDRFILSPGTPPSPSIPSSSSAGTALRWATSNHCVPGVR